MKAAARASGREIGDYERLHHWSVEDREAFWSLVWDQCGVVGKRATA
jgi:acetoacetyl-CoA synthetase